MSDSQRPKHPAAPSFEVPDLELGPAPRSFRQPANAPSAVVPPVTPNQGRGYTAPNLFEEESFQTGSLSLDLDADPRGHAPVFGSSVSFEDPDAFELERTAAPALSLHEQSQNAAKVTERIDRQGGHAAWPTGRAPDMTQLRLDPVEIAILADYGDVPTAVQLTPAYAYRVFTRQRELKRQLVSIAAEHERAEHEREATLAELASTVRPAAEKVEQFRRLFAPLVELEQAAGKQGQALSSINQQSSAHSGQFDAELSQIAEQLRAEQQLEQDAIRVYDEREAAAKRAEAKLKRAHIEIRAVTQVAEQKLGPAGGEIPEPEASQLSALRQRVEDAKPELAHTQAEFAQAKTALERARARLDALRQNERLTTRKKQAVAEQYRKELQVRSQGLNESESLQRTALADLGRAVLTAAGTVDVTESWLERVHDVSDRADKLLVRRELQVRAIGSYDQARVRQGVQLVGTVLGLFVLIVLFKLIF
ncbi:MAG: hypothetical protein ABUL62_14235 [Myxococcales bacterium]